MNANPFSLERKTILITGAGSGIGRATALQCSAMGARLVLVSLHGDKLSRTAELIGRDDTECYPVDLSDYDRLCGLVGKLPELDGVFSNAGIVKSLLAKFSEKNDMEQIFQVNTFSHINLVQQLIAQKKIKRGASIVFTSSMSGVFAGLIGGSLYGATKAALVGYTKALALELAPRGIRVNTLHPGMIETNLTDNTALSRDVLDEDARNYPLGRYGKPEEVACAAVYLLSDATAWMTGTKLLIDGGYSVK